MMSMPPGLSAHDLVAAEQSMYFSAPHVVQDLSNFAHFGADHAEEAGRAVARTSRLVLVGSGGSLACLFTAQYVLERITEVPIRVIPAKELRWRDPVWLGPGSTVVLNSWSGQSGDVLDSLEFARAKGARTVGVVADSHSPLATDVDLQIPYDGRSIYEVPIVALLHFVMGLEGVGSMDGGLRSSVLQLPERLSQLMPSAASKGAEDADRLRTVDHIYVLGAGPCSSLGLKLANVLMENVRIGSAYYDTVEFRHGAVEALDRIKPVMLVLIGSDDSREISLGMRDFSIREGAEVVAYDSADYDLMEPLLAPLIMNSFTQWFVVYSALLRGITDLDQRVYMGTGKLPQDVRS